MQGSAACLRLQQPDKFGEADRDAECNAAMLQGQLEKENESEWMPFKLTSSVISAHGNLIRSVDQLYDAYGDDLKDLKLQFPEIVVVGAEDVGKSSLLEKLAGVAIFPRGEGIVTRSPFRLRLHHRRPDEMAQLQAGGSLASGSRQQQQQQQGKKKGKEKEKGKEAPPEILVQFEDGGPYIDDVDAVRRRVQAHNKAARVSGKGVTDEQIVLNMYSPHFPDLTLLDLPGIIRARDPSEPLDIADVCEKLVRKHISNSDAIILAVLSSGEHIRGSEAVKLVQVRTRRAPYHTLSLFNF